MTQTGYPVAVEDGLIGKGGGLSLLNYRLVLDVHRR